MGIRRQEIEIVGGVYHPEGNRSIIKTLGFQQAIETNLLIKRVLVQE